MAGGGKEYRAHEKWRSVFWHGEKYSFWCHCISFPCISVIMNCCVGELLQMKCDCLKSVPSSENIYFKERELSSHLKTDCCLFLCISTWQWCAIHFVSVQRSNYCHEGSWFGCRACKTLLAQRKEFSSKVPSLLVSATCQQYDSDVNTVGLYNVWDVISVWHQGLVWLHYEIWITVWLFLHFLP